MEIENSNWEAIFGCSLAVLAAALAVADLGGGKYGGDVLELSNEKTAAYMWFQSKGIKENLAEGQAELLSVLVKAGAISKETLPAINTLQEQIKIDVERYKKEKKEILLGSKTVGEANWAQDIGGEMGKVVGAKELESEITNLGAAGDKFDLANLFLQLSLVLGAIGILTKKAALKRTFYFAMVTLGTVGIAACFLAYRLAGAF
jgi:hypothetical protein